jgi:hypothetical protein
MTNEVRQDGYQPLNEGYIPNEIRGYAPNPVAQNTTTPPSPPAGGTGESPAINQTSENK